MDEATIDGQDLYVIHYEGGGGEICKGVALLFTPAQWSWVTQSISPPPITHPELRVQQAIDTLLVSHPLQYEIEGERYNRCPVCEQWSPCDVRILISALQNP